MICSCIASISHQVCVRIGQVNGKNALQSNRCTMQNEPCARAQRYFLMQHKGHNRTKAFMKSYFYFTNISFNKLFIQGLLKSSLNRQTSSFEKKKEKRIQLQRIQNYVGPKVKAYSQCVVCMQPSHQSRRILYCKSSAKIAPILLVVGTTTEIKCTFLHQNCTRIAWAGWLALHCDDQTKGIDSNQVFL